MLVRQHHEFSAQFFTVLPQDYTLKTFHVDESLQLRFFRQAFNSCSSFCSEAVINYKEVTVLGTTILIIFDWLNKTNNTVFYSKKIISPKYRLLKKY